MGIKLNRVLLWLCDDCLSGGTHGCTHPECALWVGRNVPIGQLDKVRVVAIFTPGVEVVGTFCYGLETAK